MEDRRLNVRLISALALAVCGTVACSGQSTTSPTPPTATPTLGVIAPFSVQTTTPLSVTSGTIVVPVAAGGYSGPLTLSGASASAASGLTVTTTQTNVDPAGFPVLQSALRRSASLQTESAANPVTPLLYIDATFSANVTAGSEQLALTVPSSALIAGDTLYLAFYDPGNSAYGWQEGWTGAGVVSGTTVTFTRSAGFGFTGGVPYGFALFAIGSTAPAPTPAPTASPSAAPSVSPSASPTAAPTVAPTAAHLVYSGPLDGTTPEVTVFAPSVSATTVPGSTATFGISEAGYGGLFTATAPVATCGSIGTISPTQGTSFTFTASTAPTPGTCAITVSDSFGRTLTVVGSYTPSTPIGVQ
jgi:hypothetical protein